MTDHPARRRLLQKHYSLPSEHGAWIWWIGPLLLGAAAARRLPIDFGALFIAALAVFLLRQPAAIAVKALSGRRARADLPPATVWASAYAAIAALAIALLLARGHHQLVWLAIPGAAVFGWHLWLISRRQDRGQMGIELVGAGVLALAAPAAYWICGGTSVPLPWLLWVLTWLQSAASIVYVYQRLAQRRLADWPATAERWRMGWRTLAYHGFNVALSTGLALARRVPALVPVAFMLMLFDALEGTAHPPVGARPARIGVRQLIASITFVAVMAIAYLV